MESALKRRIQHSQSPTYNLDDQDDSYELYVPVAQRREAKLAKLTSWGANAEKDMAKKQLEEMEERKDEEEEQAKRKEKARKERTLLMEAQDVHSKKAEEGEYSICFSLPYAYSNGTDAKKTVGEKAEEADAEILAAIANRRILASDMELAKGISYTEPLKTSYVSLFCPGFFDAHFNLLAGDHQSTFATRQKSNIASYGKSFISLLMERTSLHQSSTSRT
jgi:ATP-dependent RNA helicase DDX41